MQFARSSDGRLLEASAQAPTEARCPSCGGIVVLRTRRVGPRSQIVYFWRHLDNHNLKCSQRAHRAVQS
jgi:DNA-directed RNA polymerase subunit RPC12/RpoP